MHESLEIEGKFPVPSFAPVRERLQKLAVSEKGTEYQRDVYYSPVDRDFGKTDEALRIRYGKGDVTLTYKGPRLTSHELKAREEVNVQVESGKDLEIILQRLGFIPVYIVEKQRERYDWEGVEISLDEVKGLGTFVEIEVKEGGVRPEERIEAIKKKLGIEGEHIPLSYLELLRAQRERRST
jgi:adenylate cyclase class 2